MDTRCTRQPIALVTATRREMQAVLGARGQGVSLKLTRPYELAWGPRTLLLVITGIGMVNAAMALGRLAARAPGLAGVLNLGIAGSFDPGRFPLGSVVAVQTEIWPEFGLITEHGVDPKGLGLGQGKAQGEIVWDTLAWDPDREAQGMGLELCPQWPRVTSLSVSDNIRAGAHFGSRHNKPETETIEEVIDFVGLWDQRKHKAAHLKLLDKKRTMIGAALATHPQILLLDEPIAGLNPSEIDQSLELFHRINQELGITILIIEHFMKVLTELSQQLLILENGRKICLGPPHEVTRDQRVIECYLGEEHD